MSFYIGPFSDKVSLMQNAQVKYKETVCGLCSDVTLFSMLNKAINILVTTTPYVAYYHASLKIHSTYSFQTFILVSKYD